VVDWDGEHRQPATGVFLDRQTPEAIVEAVERFTHLESAFEPSAMRSNAERFRAVYFREGIQREAALALAERPSAGYSA
jgi:hypothetical protein